MAGSTRAIPTPVMLNNLNYEYYTLALTHSKLFQSMVISTGAGAAGGL